MQLEIHNNKMCIIPQSPQDEAYLESVLGFRENGPSAKCVRIGTLGTQVGESCLSKGQGKLYTKKPIPICAVQKMKKHKKTKHWYMHTMEGLPASFFEQICYVHGGPKEVAVLVKSLKQIRRQQQLSVKFRTGRGWDIPEYGYVKVALPEQDV